MKIKKVKNTKKFRILDGDKELSFNDFRLYDQTGVLAKCENHFGPGYVREWDLDDAIKNDQFDASLNCPQVSRGRNYYHRLQRVIYLPIRPTAKRSVVRSRMGDVAIRYIDYGLTFYKPLLSVSDLYEELKDVAITPEEASAIGASIAKALKASKEIEAVDIPAPAFSVKHYHLDD